MGQLTSRSQLLLLLATLLVCAVPEQAAGQAVAAVPAAPPPAPEMQGAITAVAAPSPLLQGQPPPLLSSNTSGNGTTSKLIFCIANWEPIAMCQDWPTYSPANFSGHDVQMVRDAAALMGLTEGTDFEFKCDSFSTMLVALRNASGPCSAAVAGVTITTEREGSGIKFTYPYFKSSLSTLVQAQLPAGTGWGFTRPFSWELWLALFITLLAFPPIAFVIEFLSLRKAIHRGDILPGVVESTWRTALTLMLMDSFAVTSQGARVAVLCFVFLALLTTSTYTANLAAFVTVNTIESRITGLGDLRGRAVGTSPIYIERLTKYGIQAIPYPLNNGSDYLTWRTLVSTGELAALVRDTPALQWLANTDPLCSVVVLPQAVEPFDYGIAFHKNTSEGVVDAWSRAILVLQEDGTLQQLKDSWIVNPTQGCQVISAVNNNASAVRFQDLYGLWIILGAGIVMGALIMFTQRTMRRYEKHHGRRPRRTNAEGGPLPGDQAPKHLVSAVVAWGKRSGRRISLQRGESGRRGSGKGGSGKQPVGQQRGRHNGGGTDAGGWTAVGPAGTTEAIGQWDLESGPSSSPVSLAAAPLSSLAAAVTTPAASPAAQMQQQLQQAAPPPPPPPAAERSVSALLVADSIFAAQKWKSQMKTSGPSWGNEG